MKKDLEDKNNIDEEDIKIEEYSEFNNVAIHLDLIESEETSLIIDFYFLFLLLNFILTMKILFIFQIISKYI